MKTSRIGIFGGSFDPVHTGHFQLARQALTALNLDTILFVPVAVPPHKSRVFASFRQRMDMLKLQCAGHSNMVCCDIEGRLPRPSYTIDTVAALKDRYKNSEFFFILGVDAFLGIRTWKGFPEILSQVAFIISPRLGYDSKVLYDFFASLGYQQEGKPGYWQQPGGDRAVYLLEDYPPEASSESIRRLIATSALACDLLHPDVERYIRENRLYLEQKL